MSCYYFLVNYIDIQKFEYYYWCFFLKRVPLIRKIQEKIVWKYVIEVFGEQYLRCKFCNQRCVGGVNRLKHHLARTHYDVTKLVKMLDWNAKRHWPILRIKKRKEMNCSKKLVWVQLQCIRVPCLKQ